MRARPALLLWALLTFAACTPASRQATTETLRDLNQALIPIGALAR